MGALVSLTLLMFRLMYWMIVGPIKLLIALCYMIGRSGGSPRRRHRRAGVLVDPRPAGRGSTRTEVWRHYETALQHYVQFTEYTLRYPYWRQQYPGVRPPTLPSCPTVEPMPWAHFNERIAALENHAWRLSGYPRW